MQKVTFICDSCQKEVDTNVALQIVGNVYYWGFDSTFENRRSDLHFCDADCFKKWLKTKVPLKELYSDTNNDTKTA